MVSVRTWQNVLEERRPRQRDFWFRILVVDDEPDIRRLDSELLIDAGYEVDTASDGVMASGLLERNPYDLIITDQMPGTSGVELLQELYSARKSVPVIIATGTMPAECQQYFQVATTLIKPYTLRSSQKFSSFAFYVTTFYIAKCVVLNAKNFFYTDIPGGLNCIFHPPPSLSHH
jgi:CheY-like chemotaxis protein